MLADCCESPPRAALFRGTPPFDSSAWTPTGTGKLTFGGVGDYDEEGWTVLPKGNVLTVDAYHLNESHCDTGSEIYNPGTGAWSSGGSTIVQLPDCNTPAQSDEVGPQALRPDPNSAFDNLIAFGGTTSGTAHTAIYNATSGTWSAGPNVPSVSGVPYTLADAPAAILPSGNVLFAASPSTWTAVMATHFPPPTHFWEIGPNSAGNVITQVTDNPDGANSNSFQWNFLMLPTGQVLAVVSEGTPNVWIYTPGGNPNPSWVPVIDSSPINVSRASTYTLTGTQFNGLSHGAEYGDNVQANTNFPIVKIVNDVTGHVFYQRTFGFNTRSVARGAATSTNFMVTGKTETGPGTLYVIANGISSAGVPVVVR
jgi:hypothetical protein